MIYLARLAHLYMRTADGFQRGKATGKIIIHEVTFKPQISPFVVVAIETPCAQRR